MWDWLAIIHNKQGDDDRLILYNVGLAKNRFGSVIIVLPSQPTAIRDFIGLVRTVLGFTSDVPKTNRFFQWERMIQRMGTANRSTVTPKFHLCSSRSPQTVSVWAILLLWEICKQTIWDVSKRIWNWRNPQTKWVNNPKNEFKACVQRMWHENFNNRKWQQSQHCKKKTKHGKSPENKFADNQEEWKDAEEINNRFEHLADQTFCISNPFMMSVLFVIVQGFCSIFIAVVHWMWTGFGPNINHFHLTPLPFDTFFCPVDEVIVCFPQKMKNWEMSHLHVKFGPHFCPSKIDTWVQIQKKHWCTLNWWPKLNWWATQKSQEKRKLFFGIASNSHIHWFCFVHAN